MSSNLSPMKTPIFETSPKVVSKTTPPNKVMQNAYPPLHKQIGAASYYKLDQSYQMQSQSQPF